MQIRDADLGIDLALLAEMNLNLIADEGHRNTMNLQQLQERMKAWLGKEYEAAIFSDENTDIGYALWRKEPEYLYVRQFYIHPDFRRKGYGSEAVRWLKKHKWNNIPRIRLDVLIGNSNGMQFWRANGFEDYCITFECNDA